MLKARQQSFNGGMVKIYQLGNISEAGDMPKEGLTLKHTLRYHERTVGINRYYIALKNSLKVAAVIRCPRTELTGNLVAILNSSQQYNVIQIQYLEDSEPKVMDLTLEKVGTDYDVS